MMSMENPQPESSSPIVLARRTLLLAGLGSFAAACRSIPNPVGVAAPTEDDSWRFHDALQMAIEGRGWRDVDRPFSRLPRRAQALVREPVWQLAQDSAGLHVDFRTAGATALRIEARLLDDSLAMRHMPPTGVSGLDLYTRVDGERWRWVHCSQPSAVDCSTEIDGLDPAPRTYRLYLPLYNGVESLRIGTPVGATLEPLAPSAKCPVVYYGTSIAQGACASRPGMAFVSQLGRRLDRPMINLGFSGNGRLEPELGDLIAELDASAYVLDCLPNLSPEQTAARVEPFVLALRARQPNVPIVLVEDRVNTNAFLRPKRAEHHARNHAALRAAYRALVSGEIPGLHYVEHTDLLGDDGEATVDGSHPTDLGMVRYADALEPVLRDVLARG